MKKSYLPLSAVLLLSSVGMPAYADVLVYGKADVAIQQASEGDNYDQTELVSNLSFIGVTGSEQISGGLKAIFKFEYQTELDDGANASGQTFGQRNIYVGLQGSGGTIMGGNFDTPTKVLQEKIDLFNDREGDIINIFRGEIRAKNILQYSTPSFGGFVASGAFVGKETDGVDDGYSASLAYSSDVFYAGVSMDQDVEAMDVDLFRAVARVKIGSVQLGVLGEQYDNGITEKEDGGLVSFLWNISPSWSAKAQYGQSEVKMADGETASVGLDYKLSSNSTIYGYYTTVENDLLVQLANPRDDSYAGIGMILKF